MIVLLIRKYKRRNLQPIWYQSEAMRSDFLDLPYSASISHTVRNTAEQCVTAQKWSSGSRKLMLSGERMIALAACSPSHAAGTITLHITPHLPTSSCLRNSSWWAAAAARHGPSALFTLAGKMCSSHVARLLFHSSSMLLRASQNVCCDSFDMAEECGWSNCKALLNGACYCRWLNGSSLTQRPNHQGIENYFKNEIAVKPLIATTLPDFTPSICKYY